MSYLKLSKNFFFGYFFVGKIMREQLDDIITTQQWVISAVFNLLLQHKKHGHHNHGHVMMPTAPASGLVLSHAALILGVLENSLNQVALALHVH
jgi:hypothetical protein